VTAPLSYRASGVDIGVADAAKERIKRLVESTLTPGTRGAFGGFGGMFRMPADVPEPVLVASADGVGTKLKVAIEAGKHDTIGHDLVNHCVNDVLAQGAVPLFFLDYVAFGVLDPDVVESVVAGVAAGCRENNCALIGGETAEMPGVYTPPDYDLAGFIVGYVGEARVLGPGRVRDGDVLVGLASSGLHTNGYSLARAIVRDRMRLRWSDPFPGEECSAGEALLRTHRSYLAALGPVLSKIRALAHITGGGLPGNVRRAIPVHLDASIATASWLVPNLFVQLERAGNVDRSEMFRTFNMGVGMVAIAGSDDVDPIVRSAESAHVQAWVLGRVVRGSGQVFID
jgi:phosphoribosylformylglycinamidine cyclo-ligase